MSYRSCVKPAQLRVIPAQLCPTTQAHFTLHNDPPPRPHKVNFCLQIKDEKVTLNIEFLVSL